MSVALRIARTARSVPTGFFNTNCFRAAMMQQKYWSQGRSCAVLTITRPLFFARKSCGCGGNARNASTLPSTKDCIMPSKLLASTQLMSFRGSMPTYATIAAI